MKKKLIFGFMAVTLLCSHDLFLKLDDYFLEPQSKATIQMFNGSFDKSESTVARNRLMDASLVGNGKRVVIDAAQWMEKDQVTYLNFETGNAGTWVAGVSTTPKNIDMAAARFNKYLEHDGVIDMLQSRKENNEINQDAVEKYSKHVKTIFQVGHNTSGDWSTVLNYPIEFVPLENPYDLHKGHVLNVRLLLDGKPLKNQLVSIGNTNSNAATTNEHTHANGKKHTHTKTKESDHTHYDVIEMRTDNNGDVAISLNSSGVWFLKTIYMEKSSEPGITHESKWANLTFQVGTGHNHNTGHDHDTSSQHHQEQNDHSHDQAHKNGVDHHHDSSDHEHSHEESGVPSYIFWLGSFFTVAILFFIFNRKKKDD